MSEIGHLPRTPQTFRMNPALICTSSAPGGRESSPFFLCIVGRNSSFQLFARPRQTPKWRATNSCCARATSASSEPGIYNYLPLGQRALNKIIGIVREEMDKIGQEFYLPAILPRELWEESGPLDHHGRKHVPPQGPQGRRPVPGHDARRDHDLDCARRICALTSSCRRSGTRFKPSSATSRGPSRACCACASSS